MAGTSIATKPTRAPRAPNQRAEDGMPTHNREEPETIENGETRPNNATSTAASGIPITNAKRDKTIPWKAKTDNNWRLEAPRERSRANSEEREESKKEDTNTR